MRALTLETAEGLVRTYKEFDCVRGTERKGGRVGMSSIAAWRASGARVTEEVNKSWRWSRVVFEL